MSTWITVVSSLMSGLIATIITLIVTTILQKKNDKLQYKKQIFQEQIYSRGDITNSQSSTGVFEKAINQVFIAHNDSPDVLKCFENFRQMLFQQSRTSVDNQLIIDALISLLKEMAVDIHINYNFANDDLFTSPLIIRKK